MSAEEQAQLIESLRDEIVGWPVTSRFGQEAVEERRAIARFLRNRADDIRAGRIAKCAPDVSADHADG